MQITCQQCHVQFEKKYKNHRFCSRSCAGAFGNTGRIPSEETKRKIRETNRVTHRSRPDLLEKQERIRQERREKAAIKAITAPWDELGNAARKVRVLHEQDGRCNHCNINEWRGKPIVLEIEHKNGDRTDHRRENLEAICPNCHSQTPTWRGRNLTNTGKAKISDEDFLKALTEYPTIAKALTSLGLAPKGGNYNRAKRLLGIDPSLQFGHSSKGWRH